MPTPAGGALERWKALGIRAWTLIGLLILTGVGLWVLGRIGRALIPFLMAIVIVFLLRSPARYIEQHGAPRWLAVTICYLVSLVFLVIAGVFLLPVLAAQFTQFLVAFPSYLEQAGKMLQTLTLRYWDTAPGWIRQAAANIQSAVTAQVAGWASDIASGALAAGGEVVTLVVDALLALFLAFYILVDLHDIHYAFVRIAGPRWRPDMEVIAHEVSTVVGGFLRGQAIIAFTDGVLTAIGLTLVHMPYSGVIGLITGLLSIIPYVGPLVGGVIVVVTGLFVSPATALLGLVVMVVVQQVDGNVLGPRIMSREVDLHPALVIFSLLVGAEVAGLLGMLVAIPVAATGKALFAHYFGRTAESSAPPPDELRPAPPAPVSPEEATPPDGAT